MVLWILPLCLPFLLVRFSATEPVWISNPLVSGLAQSGFPLLCTLGKFLFSSVCHFSLLISQIKLLFAFFVFHHSTHSMHHIRCFIHFLCVIWCNLAQKLYHLCSDVFSSIFLFSFDTQAPPSFISVVVCDLTLHDLVFFFWVFQQFSSGVSFSSYSHLAPVYKEVKWSQHEEFGLRATVLPHTEIQRTQHTSGFSNDGFGGWQMQSTLTQSKQHSSPDCYQVLEGVRSTVQVILWRPVPAGLAHQRPCMSTPPAQFQTPACP